MTFDLEYIEKLTKLLGESNLSEMLLQDGEQVIELRKPACAVSGNNAASFFSSPITSSVISELPTEQPKTQENVSLKTITSPMVGTFYCSSSPSAKPFIQVGDTVSTGEVVCIIEAMKLMNEIESEVSGKITKICVENGQPVEYGQILMYVD